jgi:CMP-N-acetylneuraminic acid synthetase
MKNEIIALVPVREGSQRVKGKNFIEFVDGRSLLELKIEHLKQAGCFDRIYVSSDSERAQKIASENGVEFLSRAEVMCQAHTPWAEVVEHIMDTIPGNPIVTWALSTSPLFSRFKKAVTTYLDNKDKHDSLVAVLPKKSFFLNKYGKGINYNLGYWHPYSQELETYYEVTGACYIGRKSDMAKWKYWFGVRPYLFEVSSLESIDVDELDDFEAAQKIIKAI